MTSRVRGLRTALLLAALGWGVCAGSSWGQVCPVAPAPSGGISISSPSSNDLFLSGDDNVHVVITASGFSPTQMVAQWTYGSAWSAPYSLDLSTPEWVPVAEQTVTIQVAAMDASGDTRQASVNVRVQRDTDGDGIPDATDKCPYLSSSDQTDTNVDGIGDVCQCGDLNTPQGEPQWSGDGHVSVSDISAANACIYDPNCDSDANKPGTQPPTPHADANGDDLINASDLIAINGAIFGSCTPVCEAYPTPPPGHPPACGSE
jgi:hypothetical protein